METAFDLLIQNGTVLTMDRHNTVIEDGCVCVRRGSNHPCGQKADGKPSPSSALMQRGGLILPGLVNGHTHAAMTLFRGLADDLPLMQWLNDYIFRVEEKMDGDFVYVGTLLACAEMILSGTTTFCDMYLFENETAAAAGQAGMRCLVGEVLYDFPSPNYGTIEKGFEYTESLIERWKQPPPCPHRGRAAFSVHLQPGVAETGKSSWPFATTFHSSFTWPRPPMKRARSGHDMVKVPLTTCLRSGFLDPTSSQTTVCTWTHRI